MNLLVWWLSGEEVVGRAGRLRLPERWRFFPPSYCCFFKSWPSGWSRRYVTGNRRLCDYIVGIGERDALRNATGPGYLSEDYGMFFFADELTSVELDCFDWRTVVIVSLL